MSVNTSSLYPFNDSSSTSAVECLFTSPSSIIYSSYTILKVLLLLPLCTFILCYGLRQWKKRCFSSSSKPISHFDCFIYHLVITEVTGLVGCVFSAWAIFRHSTLLYVGYGLMFYSWFGQTLFHVLTCMERYLAVVHPITYRSLRSEQGIRVRNGTAAFILLLSVGLVLLETVLNIIFTSFSIMVMSFTGVSFFSVSVLCVLIRPGPGERGRVNQSKKRAFYTIVVVLGVLLVKFTWNMIWSVLKWSGASGVCVLMTCECWFNMPSSLLLPLLFLYKKGGKRRQWKHKLNKKTNRS